MLDFIGDHKVWVLQAYEGHIFGSVAHKLWRNFNAFRLDCGLQVYESQGLGRVRSWVDIIVSRRLQFQINPVTPSTLKACPAEEALALLVVMSSGVIYA